MSLPATLRTALLFALCGCGGPIVSASLDYDPDILRAKRVLFTRLAVSDSLGDARTGIVLSDAARTAAAAAACTRVAEVRSDVGIVCPSPAQHERLADMEKLFAADKPFVDPVLAGLRNEFGVQFAVLFRPERVQATQDVEQERFGAFFGDSNTAVPTSVITSGTHAQPWRITNETQLTYTVYAVLVDLRSARVLKAGKHTATDSHTTRHNLGFAQPPPVEPLLSELMTELGEALLED